MKTSARWFIVVWCLVLATIAIGAARSAAILDMNGAKIVVMTQDELVKLLELKEAEIKAARDERKKECGLI